MVLWRRKEDPDAYPAVPDSLRGDSMDLDGVRKTRQARADTAPSVTPYLSLRARLSQIWLNRWTLLLLLVLLRVLLLMVSLDDNVDDANREALAACTKVEDVGSAMASMPHYLSVGVNELSAQGIEASVDALVAVLDLMITGVQSLIIFVINMVTAMYTCLITAFIHGSLDVAADVTEKVTNAMNRAIQRITNSLETRVERIEDGIGDVLDAIENSFIGGVFPDFPDIDFSGPISDLRDIEINTDNFVEGLNQLNEDLPTFEEVQDTTAEAIAIPFRLLRRTIHDALDGYRFDRSVFPVASKQALSFCSDNNTISEFFDQLRDMIRTARTIFIAVLVALAVLAMAPMAWFEIKRWRRQKEHARIVGDRSYDPMDVVYIASRPMSATWGIKMASRFKGKRQILVRWAWAYATSLPALFVLALGLAGLFSCLCQLIMLRAIQDQVPKLADQVGEFADEVVTSLQAVSQEWADDANGVVLSTQGTINDDLLGWVRVATSAVNDTLTTFTDMMTLGLETVFNGTILKDPIETVIYCTIGLRVEAIQNGMTWVHDHAKVSLPQFPDNMFSNGAQDSIEGDSDLTTFLATPSSVTTDEVTGAVQRVADRLRTHIIQEVLISTGILLIYVIIVLVGVIRALVGMATPDKGRGEGGMRYTTDDVDGPHATPAVSPAHGGDHRFATQYGVENSAGGMQDDHYAREVHDEKTVAAVPGGHPQEVYSPKRTSSYGQFEPSHSKV
ncbi:hypothetical protein SODALDRAFT_333203 [Sodiomyces alkalinus F11]|uniref:Plasma membrane fusion protein PRM1 n=1 Tax=Sodiomyces alkalinus (strain CBS 110278 / VKM F-3762 / F11) TaxID=1314773 RepID=A0A3N2PVR8_SODAK|nr:hypothetical protein SODALDRAFT_333203 [Sodiomyces alkalinus F11]ROT38597.1 hypothetical protein SODALDRAFT_333203 [Sodiomyces alkalinus F11]